MEKHACALENMHWMDQWNGIQSQIGICKQDLTDLNRTFIIKTILNVIFFMPSQEAFKFPTGHSTFTFNLHIYVAREREKNIFLGHQQH